MKFDEKSCGVVVFREATPERLYLILHYPGGHWDLPKGHVEKGETEKETALRELLEETGIRDLEFVDGFREDISYIYKKYDLDSNKQVVFFLGRTATSRIEISHEHQDHMWLPFDAAYDRLTFDNAKNLLKKSKKFFSMSLED